MLKSVTLPHLRRPCSKISVMCGERQRRTALEAFSSSEGSGTFVYREYTRGEKGNKKISVSAPSHPSRHTPHITPLTIHSSLPTPHIKPLILHPLTSHLSRHTPHITPLISHPSHPTPHVTPLTSHPSYHPLTSHCTVYSYILLQTSMYPHTSHIPPHHLTLPSHITMSPSHTLIFSTLVSLNA